MLIGIDLGTTHCKAGVFGLDGSVLRLASRRMTTHEHPMGYKYFDPDELIETVRINLSEISGELREPLLAIGITSMAETGALLDLRSGTFRTPLIAWFDQCASEEAHHLQEIQRRKGSFFRQGIRPSFKSGLAKLIWLKKRQPELLKGACWLSAADALAYFLTGVITTDRSLAQRTAAYRIDGLGWDRALIHEQGLPADIFPPVCSPMEIIGQVKSCLDGLEFLIGVPVLIAGHDHVAGSFAARALSGLGGKDVLFDSIGTAESIIRIFPERDLNEADASSGFNFGPDILADSLYLMGGLSTSGGSIEWLKGVLGDQTLTYDQLDSLIDAAHYRPGEIVYLPYLAGRGSPHSDSDIRAAFIGLSIRHTRADLYQAVLEGVCYEAQFIREETEKLVNTTVQEIIVYGGGAKNPLWMQIKADIFGCPLVVLDHSEMTVVGAALYAGVGAGLYPGVADLADRIRDRPPRWFFPDGNRSKEYHKIFGTKYLGLQDALRATAHNDCA